MKLLRSQATEEDEAPALCLPISKASLPASEGRQGPRQAAHPEQTHRGGGPGAEGKERGVPDVDGRTSHSREALAGASPCCLPGGTHSLSVSSSVTLGNARGPQALLTLFPAGKASGGEPSTPLCAAGAFSKPLQPATWGWLRSLSDGAEPEGLAASAEALLLDEGVSSLPPSLAEPGAWAFLADKPAQPGTPGPFERPQGLWMCSAHERPLWDREGKQAQDHSDPGRA